MTRPNYGRNFPFELWLATVHGAPDDVIAELRRLETEELEALAVDNGVSSRPEPRPPSESWLGNITDSMVAKAWTYRGGFKR
jgi:hypothetical protein